MPVKASSCGRSYLSSIILPQMVCHLAEFTDCIHVRKPAGAAASLQKSHGTRSGKESTGEHKKEAYLYLSLWRNSLYCLQLMFDLISCPEALNKTLLLLQASPLFIRKVQTLALCHYGLLATKFLIEKRFEKWSSAKYLWCSEGIQYYETGDGLDLERTADLNTRNQLESKHRFAPKPPTC